MNQWTFIADNLICKELNLHYVHALACMYYIFLGNINCKHNLPVSAIIT